MSNRLHLIPAALICVLVGVLSAEIVSAPVRATAAAPLPQAVRTAPPRAAIPAADRIPAYVRTVLARPLFRADRRPVSVAAAAVATPLQAAGLPRLSGIMVSLVGREAIFEGDGKPIVAHVGDRLGRYTVASIAVGSVTLQGPGGAQTLVPSFNGKPGNGKPGLPTAAAEAAPSSSTPMDQLLAGTMPDLPIPPPATLRTLANQRRAIHAQP